MFSKTTLIKILLLLLVWRISLFLVGFLAQYSVSYEPSFPYVENVLVPLKLPQWLYSWANFDGVHYITIAQEGYGYASLTQAFFPVYPILMRLVQYVFGFSYLLSGLLISHVFLVLFVLVFFQYIAQRFNEDLAWKSLLVILTFPTSYFLVGVYSESLFLFLAALSFLLARNRLWLLAGCVVAIASATRLVGIFLVPALAVDLFLQQYQITRSTPLKVIVDIAKEFLIVNWKALIAISIGVLGVGLYMLFLWKDYNDPLYFFHVQSEFGSNRQESIILLPQVFYRYLKILISARPINWKYYSYVQDFVLTLASFGLIAIGVYFRKFKIKVSEIIFILSAWLLPTFTGSFSSMPRYILVCFPLFYLIPQLFQSKRLFILYLLVSSIFLILNIMLFVQGYWIA